MSAKLSDNNITQTNHSPREGGLHPISSDMLDAEKLKSYSNPAAYSGADTPEANPPEQSPHDPLATPEARLSEEDAFAKSVTTASTVVTAIGWLGIPIGSIVTIMGFYAINVPIIFIGISLVMTSVGLLRFSPTARYVYMFLHALSALGFAGVILHQLTTSPESGSERLDQIPMAIICILANITLLYFFNRPQVKRLFLFQ